METITISKAEMKAMPEPFSYNLFLLLDIALLSMFLFIHIFPFSHYFSSFSLFEDSGNLCGKWSIWNLTLPMAWLTCRIFKILAKTSIPRTTAASCMENKRKVMEKLAEISLSYFSSQKKIFHNKMIKIYM